MRRSNESQLNLSPKSPNNYVFFLKLGTSLYWCIREYFNITHIYALIINLSASVLFSLKHDLFIDIIIDFYFEAHWICCLKY